MVWAEVCDGRLCHTSRKAHFIIILSYIRLASQFMIILSHIQLTIIYRTFRLTQEHARYSFLSSRLCYNLQQCVWRRHFTIWYSECLTYHLFVKKKIQRGYASCTIYLQHFFILLRCLFTIKLSFLRRFFHFYPERNSWMRNFQVTSFSCFVIISCSFSALMNE